MFSREVEFQFDGQRRRLPNIVNFPRQVMFGALGFYFGRSCRLLNDLTGNGITLR